MIYLKDKKILVLGAGRSGVSVAELLKSRGARVLLYDSSEALKDNRELVDSLLKAEIPFVFSADPVENDEYEFCVISPGIPDNAPILTHIRDSVPLVSEIEVAFWFCNAPVIAISGSNGKSTVTTLIALLLQNSGVPSVACGNIGFSFSRAVLSNTDSPQPPVYVVEVSSFQLEHISLFSPNTSVLLNITPDHLDRYPDFAAYRNAKLNLLNHQGQMQRAVLNMDDANIRDHVRSKASRCPVSRQRAEGQIAWYADGSLHWQISGNENQLHESEIKLPGEHNKYNIMMAVSAVLPFLADDRGLISTLRSFAGIPHRLEFCRELDGVSWYNDSKATNLDSVLAAVTSFSDGIHLILGGKDKAGDFTVLRPYLDRIKAIYTIGQAAEKIRSQLLPYPVTSCETLDNAISQARESAVSGDRVLLSPGCASFDQFLNFEDRGNQFKILVEALS